MRTGCPKALGRRSRAKSTALFTRCGASATDVTPSAANGAAVEPLRALHFGCSHSGGPASGMAGGRDDDLARAQRAKQNAAQRSGAQPASIGPVRQAGPSVAYSRRTSGPAVPGHGKGRLRDVHRRSRPDRVALGMEARQGRDAKRLDAQQRQPGPRAAGKRAEPTVAACRRMRSSSAMQPRGQHLHAMARRKARARGLPRLARRRSAKRRRPPLGQDRRLVHPITERARPVFIIPGCTGEGWCIRKVE
jgi:hypothetical protein